jgi:hypothetical protein
MAIKYPLTAITLGSKIEFLMRTREHCRMLHNFVGYWYRNGLTEQEYNNGVPMSKLGGESETLFTMGPELKAMFVYRENITYTQFENFIVNQFHPRWNIIEDEFQTKIMRLQKLTSHDSKISLDIL